MGKLRIVIVDRDGHALAARVSVSGPDGRAYAPDDAWRHADEAFDRAERPFEYSYFHTVGTADVTVPAGGGHYTSRCGTGRSTASHTPAPRAGPRAPARHAFGAGGSPAPRRPGGGAGACTGTRITAARAATPPAPS